MTAPERARTTVGPPRRIHGTPRCDAAVAVCIPVYQGGRHLASTLRSVTDQTWPDVEIVVLDNASTDATPRLLAEVDDPRLVVWRNPATVPMTQNFNRVVALSRAPLVKVLPADDQLEPGCLAAQVAALRRDPGLALVASRSHLIDEHDRTIVRGRFLRGMVGRLDRDEVVRRVVRHGANPIGAEVATMFTRSAFDAAGGYRDRGMHTDLDLWLRLVEHGGFLGRPEALACFRIATGTVSAAAGREAYREQRRFTVEVAHGSRGFVRRRDLMWSRVHAPLARRRRELLFVVNALRGAGAPRTAVRDVDAVV